MENMYLLSQQELADRDNKFFKNGVHSTMYENPLFIIPFPEPIKIPSDEEILTIARREGMSTSDINGIWKGLKMMRDLILKKK